MRKHVWGFAGGEGLSPMDWGKFYVCETCGLRVESNEIPSDYWDITELDHGREKFLCDNRLVKKVLDE